MTKALMEYLKNIKGRDIKINGNSSLDSIDIAPNLVKSVNILKKGSRAEQSSVFSKISVSEKEYKVTVKLYMTKPDSVNFTFHTTWNNGKAMPLRVMYGKVLESTKNMVKMSLRGKITETSVCLKCGKVLTNDISKLYGLGPECGQHYYINPLTKEDFEKYKDSIKNKFEEIRWEGWIPKVSIISMEELNG